LQNYLASESKACSDWAIPIIRTAMKASEYPILLQVIIRVNGCSAGSIVLDFDLEHGSEPVLQLAARNLNETETVLDEGRSINLNVAEFTETTVTNSPTASPSTSVSDAGANTSITAESSLIMIVIIMFIVLVVIIICLVLLVLIVFKRGQSKKFQETQHNMIMEMGSMSASNSPRSPGASDFTSQDGMMETGAMDIEENVVPGGDRRIESVAAASQQKVIDEILNGNLSTAGGPDV